MGRRKAPRVRKTPQRMCVGCGELKPKKELVRIVRTPDAQILLDATGKQSGRGAYICPDRACLQRAVKQKGLERALGHPVSAAVMAELEAGMPGVSDPG